MNPYANAQTWPQPSLPHHDHQEERAAGGAASHGSIALAPGLEARPEELLPHGVQFGPLDYWV